MKKKTLGSAGIIRPALFIPPLPLFWKEGKKEKKIDLSV